jgi:hypothetical protein
MTAILASFLETAIKFVLLLLVAGGGIMCGKKFRDYKDLKKSDQIKEKN